MQQGNYGFVDALEWAKNEPYLDPTDVGATVEISGNQVVGRLWCSANIPKFTRVRRINEVFPEKPKPSFKWDEKFKADRQAQEEIISKAYERKRRVETYWERIANEEATESSGDEGLLDSTSTSNSLPTRTDVPVPEDPDGPFGLAPFVPIERKAVEQVRAQECNSIHESTSEYSLPSLDQDGNPKEYPDEESEDETDSIKYPLHDEKISSDPEGFYTPLVTPDTSCEPTSSW
mmetsp:Transcript_20170/g.49549  ORF Transcript_20170/g.49549 Transcript_20170/m.49549 type:complete len:233 (+) Transcript_20170:2-700(+)